MKPLSIIILSTVWLSTSLSAGELDSIDLIYPVSYERASSASQTFKSKLMAGAASTFNIDIEKKVITKIAP